MIGKKMRDLMNEQIKNELESYYIYLSMVAYFHSQNLDGMAHWMRCQAHEEMIHAMKFYDHIIDRGGTVELLNLKQLKTKWKSPLEAWQDTLEHEKFITAKIHDLVKLSRKENDIASDTLLNWFSKEQIEEESNAEKDSPADGNDRRQQAGDLPAGPGSGRPDLPGRLAARSGRLQPGNLNLYPERAPFFRGPDSCHYFLRGSGRSDPRMAMTNETTTAIVGKHCRPILFTVVFAFILIASACGDKPAPVKGGTSVINVYLDPVQEPCTSTETFQRKITNGSVTMTPVAAYRIAGNVMSKRKYTHGWGGRGRAL